MIFRDETALQIAEILLQIKAVKLQPSNPFTWASGWKSPIYCDNRKILSYPDARAAVRDAFAATINEKAGDYDLIAGVATGGIAHGALVAEILHKPFAYVRSSSKGHGLQNAIEGVVEPGSKVVVIEDLISTGGSSLQAVEALRDRGCEVVVLLAIFSYGFEVAETNFTDAKCPYITLSNYEYLIQHALKTGYIAQDQLNSLESWRKAPATWGTN